MKAIRTVAATAVVALSAACSPAGITGPDAVASQAVAPSGISARGGAVFNKGGTGSVGSGGFANTQGGTGSMVSGGYVAPAGGTGSMGSGGRMQAAGGTGSIGSGGR